MSQKEQIKQYLLTGKTLTPLECLQKGWGLRLGARIWDLRRDGYKIKNVGSDEGSYAVYKMDVGEKIATAVNIAPVQFRGTPIFKDTPKTQASLL